MEKSEKPPRKKLRVELTAVSGNNVWICHPERQCEGVGDAVGIEGKKAGEGSWGFIKV
jgi:hypothetical protein